MFFFNNSDVEYSLDKFQKIYYTWKRLNFLLSEVNSRKVPFRMDMVADVFSQINSVDKLNNFRNINNLEIDRRVSRYFDFFDSETRTVIDLQVGITNEERPVFLNQFDEFEKYNIKNYELHYASLDIENDLLHFYKVSLNQSKYFMDKELIVKSQFSDRIRLDIKKLIKENDYIYMLININEKSIIKNKNSWYLR